jgi:pimeloyl-ACP methyl ester carboxylesterase
MRVIKAVVAIIVLMVVAAVGAVYTFPEQATRVALDLERSRAGLVRKQIVLPGGLRYVYLEGGAGEPLLLLHGFGADKDNFTKVARFLTPHYRVIVPDHIGFGESAHPPQADYSPPAQARRLHALVRALGVQRLHLGGNSMGGQIALSYAVLYSNEVASLWLLDPGGVWSVGPSELAKTIAATGHNPMLVRSADDFARLIGLVMTDPPFIPPPMRNVLARERIANYELERRIFDEIRADSVEARVRGLPTPTLIVWGEQDRVLNVGSAQILHRLMPNSEVVIMHAVGHLPMLERPRESAADYLRFRASLAAATAR